MSCYNLILGQWQNVLQHIKNVDLLFTSPPYNIGSKAPKKLTNRKYGGYDSKSWGSIEDYPDTMEETNYQKSQKNFLEWAAVVIKSTGNILYNHKLRRKNDQLIDPSTWFPSSLYEHDRIVLNRKTTNNHCKSYTYDIYEYLYCLRKNKKAYFKNNGLGNVWGTNRDYNNKHNAPFSIEFARQVIRLWCPPDGLVCDPYSGSGTVMIAAALEGRRFVGSEMLPKYHKLAIDRLYDATKKNASV